MYLVKSPLIFVFFLLYFSSSYATTANIDPSKYTIGFKFDDKYECLGGIIGERILISAVQCFSYRNGTSFGYEPIKAVVGSIEVPVAKVVVPKFPPSEGFVLRDYALVYLDEDLNLDENGLTRLYLPAEATKVNSLAVVSRDNSDEAEILKIVDPKNCQNARLDSDRFIAESHLCVENSKDQCSNLLGAPLVVQGDDGINYLIGVRANCYEQSQYEMFANTYFGVGKPSQFLPPHVYTRVLKGATRKYE